MLLQMIHDVNPHVINHWFQFGFTKRFKAVSSKYCCNLCNRSFFCFHNLCRWICKLVNLHMYFFFAWSSFQVRSNIWCFFAWSSFQARSNIWCRSFEKTRFRSFHRYVDKWGMKFENLQMFNSTCSIIYSQRVLFYPENILLDYVCRFGFNLWILDFIDFCETTSDRHFLYKGENKVPFLKFRFYSTKKYINFY